MLIAVFSPSSYLCFVDGKQAEWLSNLLMHGTAYVASLLELCLSIHSPRCAKPGLTRAVAPVLAMDASAHPPLVVEIVSCNPGCVAEDGLKLQTLLLHPHECWDHRLAPPLPGCGMLGLEALYILSPFDLGTGLTVEPSSSGCSQNSSVPRGGGRHL